MAACSLSQLLSVFSVFLSLSLYTTHHTHTHTHTHTHSHSHTEAVRTEKRTDIKQMELKEIQHHNPWER